jgi:hypothetical protein
MMVALASRAAEGEGRRERLRRSRAAAVALRVAFPAVERLRIELVFEGSSSTTPAPQSHVLHPPARAFFEFPCPYADCDGQFDLKAAVNAALTDATHRAQASLECPGKRTRHIGSKQPCQLRLFCTVEATYQPQT